MTQTPVGPREATRSLGSIAVEIDHTLDRLLQEGTDREELWPLIYEYGARGEEKAAVIERERFRAAIIAVAEHERFDLQYSAEVVRMADAILDALASEPDR